MPEHRGQIVGPGDLTAVFWERYRPDAILARHDGVGPSVVPLLEGRIPHAGGPLAYVCRRFVCEAPVSSPDRLRTQLA